MKLRDKLIILLILITLVVEAATTFASPQDESDKPEPHKVDFGNIDRFCGPPREEPLPCTNQRYKAWFCCS